MLPKWGHFEGPCWPDFASYVCEHKKHFLKHKYHYTEMVFIFLVWVEVMLFNIISTYFEMDSMFQIMNFMLVEMSFMPCQVISTLFNLECKQLWIPDLGPKPQQWHPKSLKPDGKGSISSQHLLSLKISPDPWGLGTTSTEGILRRMENLWAGHNVLLLDDGFHSFWNSMHFEVSLGLAAATHTNS